MGLIQYKPCAAKFFIAALFKIIMIKAVLFDLDNTLVDFLKLKQMAVEAAVAAMIDAGLNLPREKIIEVIDKVYQEKGIEYQYVFDDVLKELVGKIDYKILASGVSAYRKIKSAHLDPYPGVTPTLIELSKRGYRLGVISDAPKMQMWTRLCDTRLQHFFEFVIASEDTEQKPSALPFNRALEMLKLEPGQVLMVGDSKKRDVIGAKSVGMKTVLAKYGRVLDSIIGIPQLQEKIEVAADYEINEISDILNILK